MPTEFTLKCKVHKKWVKQWKDGSVTFCFGRTMDGTNFDLIATAEKIDPTLTVVFEDEYCIAALDTLPEPGVPINPATSWTTIEFGQKYVVDQSWTDIPPMYSDQAPAKGFLFQNVDVDAGVIVAKRFEGNLIPLFASPVLFEPHGTEGGFTMNPEITFAVWWQVEGSDERELFVLTMDELEKQLDFRADGTWAISA